MRSEGRAVHIGLDLGTSCLEGGFLLVKIARFWQRSPHR
jgi:hypothetical protein